MSPHHNSRIFQHNLPLAGIASVVREKQKRRKWRQLNSLGLILHEALT